MKQDELVAKLWMQYSRIVIVDGDTPGHVDMVNETGFKFAIREAILETRKQTLLEAINAECSLCKRGDVVVDTRFGPMHRLKDALTGRGEPYREVRCAASKIRRLSPPTAETSAVEGK